MKVIAFLLLGTISATLALEADVFSEAYNRHLNDVHMEFQARQSNGSNPFMKSTPTSRKMSMEGHVIQRMAKELGVSGKNIF